VDFNRILAGILHAAKLDENFYEEAEADTSYGKDALRVVTG
jgi:hypothetical protein